MKKLNDLPARYDACFRQFMTAANEHDIILESLDVAIDENGVLHFQINIANGLTKEEGQSVFGEFIGKYPQCVVNHNLRMI